MATISHSQFHELVVRSKGDMPLKKLCEQEGVSYYAYMKWRYREGISPRRSCRSSQPVPSGMVEIIADDIPQAGPSPMANLVYIEFANGLKFDHAKMEVDSLIKFLTEIRGVLCLG